MPLYRVIYEVVVDAADETEALVMADDFAAAPDAFIVQPVDESETERDSNDAENT